MKDLIDERNKREKMKKSIVKFWNVNYVDAETLRKQQEEAEEAERLKALEEAERAAEMNRAYEEASNRRNYDYNPTTGSYSGEYGQGEVDEVTKGQIDKILQEKDEILRSLIDGER